jgi:hypothetical protein
VGFVFADFLHDAEDVYAGEEGAPGVVCDGRFRKFELRDTEFVDFGVAREVGLGVGRWVGIIIAAETDWGWEGFVGVGGCVRVFFWWGLLVLFVAFFLVFVYSEARVGAAEVEEAFRN